jgi:hypothetical protein
VLSTGHEFVEFNHETGGELSLYDAAPPQSGEREGARLSVGRKGRR